VQEEKDQAPEDLLRELQEEHISLKLLKEQPGYKYLIEIADAQIESRRGQFELKALTSINDILPQEFFKGEISGIDLFRRFVDVRLQIVEENIQELTKEIEENARRNSDSSSSDDSGRAE